MLALLAAGLFASLADAQTNPPPTAKMRVYTRDSLGISPPEPLEEVQLGPGPIEKIAAQGRPQKPEDEIADFQLRLEPPDPERLFLRDSERGFQDRVRQEARNRLGAVRGPHQRDEADGQKEGSEATEGFHAPRSCSAHAVGQVQVVAARRTAR